jgi:hypothetical protein
MTFQRDNKVAEINLVNWLKQSSREDNLNKILK